MLAVASERDQLQLKHFYSKMAGDDNKNGVTMRFGQAGWLVPPVLRM